MRPFSATRAAVCAQAGARVSAPAAPNARLPKPARRKSRRAMPPRRENMDVIGASLVHVAGSPDGGPLLRPAIRVSAFHLGARLPRITLALHPGYTAERSNTAETPVNS